MIDKLKGFFEKVSDVLFPNNFKCIFCGGEIFDDNVLKITTKTAIGDAADQCPIDGDGGGLEIGFNNKYLMDALKAAPADRVRIELSSGVSPCVILPTGEGEEHFLYMVLPVRLKAGE